MRKGSKATEEQKRKNSEAQKGKKMSEQSKVKISNFQKGRTKSEETKRKISNSKKGISKTEQHKIKISIVKKQNYKNDRDLREKYLLGFQNKFRNNPDFSEVLAMKILDGLNVKYEFQKIMGNKYIVDFYIPSKNLVIEIDGGIHKANFKRQKDEQRDKEFLKHGIKVIRINSDNVYSLEDCV